MGESSPFSGIDPASLLHPPKAIAVFIERLTSGVFAPEKERRKEPRYSVATIVEVQPLDEEFQSQGDVFQVVTRDISASGIGILDSRPVNCKYLAVQLTSPEGRQMQMVMEVLRCQPMGNIYDIGGKFVTEQGAAEHCRKIASSGLAPAAVVSAGQPESDQADEPLVKLDSQSGAVVGRPNVDA